MSEKLNNNYLLDVGNRLETLREQKGWKQEYVASQLNVPRSTIAKWENGQQDFKSEAIWKLSNLYDVSADYILRGVSAEYLKVNKKLGLNDETVRILSQRKEIDEMFSNEGELPFIDTLNQFLSDREFMKLIGCFSSIKKEYRNENLKLKALEKELSKLSKETTPNKYYPKTDEISAQKKRMQFIKWDILNQANEYFSNKMED